MRIAAVVQEDEIVDIRDRPTWESLGQFGGILERERELPHRMNLRIEDEKTLVAMAFKEMKHLRSRAGTVSILAFDNEARVILLQDRRRAFQHVQFMAFDIDFDESHGVVNDRVERAPLDRDSPHWPEADRHAVSRLDRRKAIPLRPPTHRNPQRYDALLTRQGLPSHGDAIVSAVLRLQHTVQPRIAFECDASAPGVKQRLQIAAGVRANIDRGVAGPDETVADVLLHFSTEALPRFVVLRDGRPVEKTAVRNEATQHPPQAPTHTRPVPPGTE